MHKNYLYIPTQNGHLDDNIFFVLVNLQNKKKDN